MARKASSDSRQVRKLAHEELPELTGVLNKHISHAFKVETAAGLLMCSPPAAACRAIVFASIVPDLRHTECPPAFMAAVPRLLRDRVPPDLAYIQKGRETVPDPDPYWPYEAVPGTLRNRLLAFIAKWSREKLDFEAGKSQRAPKRNELLDDRSLVEWETNGT